MYGVLAPVLAQLQVWVRAKVVLRLRLIVHLVEWVVRNDLDRPLARYP